LQNGAHISNTNYRKYITIPEGCNEPHNRAAISKWQRCYPYHCGPGLLKGSSLPTL
jgi:hypothetical protein